MTNLNLQFMDYLMYKFIRGIIWNKWFSLTLENKVNKLMFKKQDMSID